MTTFRKIRAPLGWMALGWTLAMLYVLGPRTAINRGLDVGYSLAAWLSSLT